MERYRSLNPILRKEFGGKVFKISLFTGLSCPNRDGSLDSRGCLFCEGKSSTARSFDGGSLKGQLAKGIDYVRRRHNAERFIAYFQEDTNTYASPDCLKGLYDQVFEFDDVVGLSVSTRPDCLPDEVLDLLVEYSKKTYFWLELGLQSANDKTLELIRRGHTADRFADAAKRVKLRGLRVCAHVILGLPGEVEDDFIKTAGFLNKTGVEGVKIHNLFVPKGTDLEKMVKEKKYSPMTLEQYVDYVVKFLEHLSPEIVIHRFNAHTSREKTFAPDWSINKFAVVNAVERALVERNTYQGRRYSV